MRLLEGGGERAELELVAGEIAALLGAEWRLRRSRSSRGPRSGIADLLEEVLDRRRDPVRAAATASRSPGAAIGRALIGLLRCAGGEGAPGRGDLLAWLRAPGMLERPELADRLGDRVRRTGTQDAAGARALWEERALAAGARSTDAREPSSGAPLP